MAAAGRLSLRPRWRGLPVHTTHPSDLARLHVPPRYDDRRWRVCYGDAGLQQWEPLAAGSDTLERDEASFAEEPLEPTLFEVGTSSSPSSTSSSPSSTSSTSCTSPPH